LFVCVISTVVHFPAFSLYFSALLPFSSSHSSLSPSLFKSKTNYLSNILQDDDEYGNGKTRIGGPLAQSDSEDNLDEDEPMTMGNMKNMTTRNNNNNNLKIYYNNHQNSSKKPFKMEVVDF
jgi:hypothetical protein